MFPMGYESSSARDEIYTSAKQSCFAMIFVLFIGHNETPEMY